VSEKAPRQRGSEWGYLILIFLYKLLGYKFLRFFLFFVVSYYFITARDVKKIAKKQYENIGLKYSNALYFKHLYSFAIAILDRFGSGIEPLSFAVESINSDAVRDGKDGSILLISHFGGWGIAQNLMRLNCPINIVMKEAYKKDIKRIEKTITAENETLVNVIDLNDGFSALAQIASALGRKEIVGMMVDRVYSGNGAVDANFFGKKIELNKNPFELAYRMGVPMYTVFVMGDKQSGYKFVFSDALSGGNIEELAESYANKLEEAVKNSPLSWFNFYDFWKADK
jgi:predicted LPLAT superfamily acyltransferase